MMADLCRAVDSGENERKLKVRKEMQPRSIGDGSNVLAKRRDEASVVR